MTDAEKLLAEVRRRCKASPQEIRLVAGELTHSEMLLVRAILNWVYPRKEPHEEETEG